MGVDDTKVRVTKMLGGAGSILGWMSPRPGMQTHRGPILSVNTDFLQCVIGLGSGDTPWLARTADLYVLESEASGNFSWPSGDNSVLAGHSDLADFGPGVGTGISYSQYGEIITFGR